MNQAVKKHGSDKPMQPNSDEAARLRARFTELRSSFLEDGVHKEHAAIAAPRPSARYSATVRQVE